MILDSTLLVYYKEVSKLSSTVLNFRRLVSEAILCMKLVSDVHPANRQSLLRDARRIAGGAIMGNYT